MSKNERMGELEFVQYELSTPTQTAVLARISADELLGKLVDSPALGLEHDNTHTASWCGDPYNRSC